MIIRVLLPTLALLALSGCGQKGPSTSAKPETGAASTSTTTTPGKGTPDTAPASSPSAAPGATTTAAPTAARTIEITANDQMKFSASTIEAKPGETLRVVLTNVGTIPKEAMGHNWVLLKAGSNVMAFGMAAASARDHGFIPQNLAGQVVAKIDLLGPREKGEVTFTVPTQTGDYPFICSFPGHATLMNGKLVVK